MLVWRKGNINKNCLCVTVLCTIIMVHKDTSSSYRSVNPECSHGTYGSGRVIGFLVLDIFLSDWYHYQCMGHTSVVTTAESCYSVKTGLYITEDHHHHHRLVPVFALSTTTTPSKKLTLQAKMACVTREGTENSILRYCFPSMADGK